MRLFKIVTFSFLALTSVVQAQISDQSTIPFSTKDRWGVDQLPTSFHASLNTDIESLNQQKHQGYKVAEFLPASISPEYLGQWTITADGDYVWRAKIQVENAMALGFYFEQFELVPGAYLHFYDPLKDHVIGAYTHKNNKSSRKFATEFVSGDIVVIELFEPAKLKGHSKIKINRVAAYFRGVDVFQLKNSDTCQVDVNCSEGAGWEGQRDAVVRLSIAKSDGVYFCSGALINNEREDCKPYILSAFHCIEDNGNPTSAGNLQQMVVRFNYQKANCNSGGANAQTMSGSTLRAHSDDPNVEGSDFCLLELDEDVPFEYNPFMAGWKVSEPPAESGVSIHHPSGDVKKISTYNSTLVSDNFSGSTHNHWRVNWVATINGHGVTEQGSSGSPIFDENGRIVGQLTGGSSFCTNPNAPDYYGKMSVNWDGNSTPSNLYLKTYLDPDNTGVTSMEGTRYWCANAIDEKNVTSLQIYPQPAKEHVYITSEQSLNINGIYIYNTYGALVEHIEGGFGKETVKLTTSHWKTGTYIIQIVTKDKVYNEKIVKQ